MNNQHICLLKVFATCLASSIFLALGCSRPATSKKSGEAEQSRSGSLAQEGAHFKHLTVGGIAKWGQGVIVTNGQEARGIALHLDLATKELFEHDVDVWCEPDADETFAYSGWSHYGEHLTFLVVQRGKALDSVRVGISIRQKLGQAATAEPFYRVVLDGRVLERARAKLQSASKGDSSSGMRSLCAQDYLDAEAELVKEGVDIKREDRVWPQSFAPF